MSFLFIVYKTVVNEQFLSPFTTVFEDLCHSLLYSYRADCIVKRACLLYQLARYLIKISQLGSLGKIASALIAR